MINPTPMPKLQKTLRERMRDTYNLGNAHTFLYKAAGDAVTTHALSGELYLSKSDWILLSVPNSLVRGAFDALDEHGVELPLQSDGTLNAHISVMRPEELDQIGGPDKISERGHHFRYTLGPVKEAKPDSWEGISKVWFIEIKSKDLQNLRKSYGLSPLPNNNKFQFHITIGRLRKKVLRNNDIAKESSMAPANRKAIILGNTELDTYPAEREQFYKQLATHLRSRGYDPTHHETEDDLPEADLYVGHGHGADRLPKDINAVTFDTTPHEHYKSKVYTATQQQLAKSLGYDNWRKMPKGFRNNLPAEHYQLNADLVKNLDRAINYNPAQQLAANDTVTRSIEKSLADGSNYGWIAPATAGVGLAGLGTAMLSAFKEGSYEDQSEEDTTNEQEACEDKPSEISLSKMLDEAQEKDESDFECSPEALDGIYRYYEPKRTEKSGVVGNNKFELSDTYQVPMDLANKGISKGKEKIKQVYAKLENRYGPTMAKVIIGAGVLGAPIPGPGSSFVTAAPFLAAGEVMHAFKGDYVPPANEEEAQERRNKRNQMLKTLGAIAAPIAGTGAAAYALHNKTDTAMPAQATKFPGRNYVDVIRGLVSPSAPASTFERTGNSYMVASDDTFHKTHGVVNNIDELGDLLRKKLPEGKKLEMLELHGHGTPTNGQYVGNAIGPDGREASILSRVNPKTVDKVVKEFKSIPWADNATYMQGGCNTGLCDPVNKSKPKHQALQYLADNVGINVMGSRGYNTVSHGTADNMIIRGEVPGLPRIQRDTNTEPGQDFAWSVHKPNQPKSVLVDEDVNSTTKRTFSSMPSSSAFNFLYNAGKPSAILGALASPMLSNERYARNTALATSAIAAPMAISEILTRYGQASGENQLGNGNGLSTHLNAQSKALPYVALAGLPLLSYGAAKLLGRWDKKKEKQPVPVGV